MDMPTLLFAPLAILPILSEPNFSNRIRMKDIFHEVTSSVGFSVLRPVAPTRSKLAGGIPYEVQRADTTYLSMFRDNRMTVLTTSSHAYYSFEQMLRFSLLLKFSMAE